MDISVQSVGQIYPSETLPFFLRLPQRGIPKPGYFYPSASQKRSLGNFSSGKKIAISQKNRRPQRLHLTCQRAGTAFAKSGSSCKPNQMAVQIRDYPTWL